METERVEIIRRKLSTVGSDSLEGLFLSGQDSLSVLLQVISHGKVLLRNELKGPKEKTPIWAKVKFFSSGSVRSADHLYWKIAGLLIFMTLSHESLGATADSRGSLRDLAADDLIVFTLQKLHQIIYFANINA